MKTVYESIIDSIAAALWACIFFTVAFYDAAKKGFRNIKDEDEHD